MDNLSNMTSNKQQQNDYHFNKIMKYNKGNTCLFLCALFVGIFHSPSYRVASRQTSEAIIRQLAFVETLEERLSTIETAIASGNVSAIQAQESVAGLASLVHEFQEVKLKGSIVIKTNPTPTPAASPGPTKVSTPEPTAAPQTYKIKNFSIHSISHTDSQEDRFPTKAHQATDLDPYLAETHYNNGTNPSESIFFGSGGPYYPEGVNGTTDEKGLVWPTINATEAHCTLRANKFYLYWETPHNFQQLIRCFSWWQMPINKGKQPVLHIQKWGHHNGSVKGFEFIHAYYKAMADVFNVRLEIEARNIPEHVRNNEIFVDAPWHKDMPTQTNAYVMKDPEHAKTLVNGMLNFYTPNNPNRAGCPATIGSSNKTKPVIGFLDRQDSRRKLSNSHQIIAHLKAAGYDNIRYLPAMGNLTFVEQIKFMSEVDILMGPHGAQFTNSLYLPTCGSLLEFFPHSYYTPGWFGSLVALSGKHHFFTYNGGEVRLNRARGIASFAVNPYAVETIVPVMVQRWESCCATQQRQSQLE